jgi:hypothetical protein
VFSARRRITILEIFLTTEAALYVRATLVRRIRWISWIHGSGIRRRGVSGRRVSVELLAEFL